MGKDMLIFGTESKRGTPSCYSPYFSTCPFSTPALPDWVPTGAITVFSRKIARITNPLCRPAGYKRYLNVPQKEQRGAEADLAAEDRGASVPEAQLRRRCQPRPTFSPRDQLAEPAGVCGKQTGESSEQCITGAPAVGSGGVCEPRRGGRCRAEAANGPDRFVVLHERWVFQLVSPLKIGRRVSGEFED